jgi:putative ABC transport system permease protein
MRIPWGLILAHARKTWLRTLLTVGSVFVAIVIFGFLRSFIVGLDASIADASSSRLVSASRLSLFAHLPIRLQPELKQRPGIVDVTHGTWFGGIYKDESPEHFWGRFGVEVPSFRRVYGMDLTLDDEVWKRWEENRTGCIIGAQLAKDERLGVGDRVRLVGNLFPGTIDLEVVGIYRSRVRSFDEKTLFFHWDYMNELSRSLGGRQDQVSTFTMLLEDPEAAGAISKEIDESYDSSAHRTWTLTERQFQAQFTSMWGNLPLFFTLLGSIVLLACLMVTANTMLLNARERIPETGILKTLGFPPGSVAAMALIEGLLHCLLGGALAMAFVRSLDGKMVVWVIMTVPWSTVLYGLAIATALGILSGLFPALLTHRLSILEAIRRKA